MPVPGVPQPDVGLPEREIPAPAPKLSMIPNRRPLGSRFPIADVLWTLVMAINVFLIVYRRYDTETLRRLEWKYITVITTSTFIPALVFLFIRTDDKGPMYGSVTVCGAFSPAK